MFNRLLKILIGLTLLPVAIGVSMAFYDVLLGISSVGKGEYFFLLGLVSYILIHLLLFQPQAVYVFGHEAVHAVFSWLFGGKVKSFKASSKGGSVATTKTNFIISLAPYFFPFYTVLISLIYLLLLIFYRETPHYVHPFIFLLGFSLSFHLIMTANTLRTNQPDIAENGYIFSFSLIYIINLLVVVFILSFVFNNIHVPGFFKSCYLHTKDLIELVLHQLFSLNR